MGVDINLIPEELRIKPLIDGKSIAAIVAVLILAFGCYYFYNVKSDNQAAITNLRSQITATQQQTAAVSGNAEALQLINSINQLKASQQAYDAFKNKRVLMGYALADVYSLIPLGVEVSSITQTGNTLAIVGSAQSYTYASDFGRALDNDPRFTLLGLPSFSNGGFSLSISVATGGAR